MFKVDWIWRECEYKKGLAKCTLNINIYMRDLLNDSKISQYINIMNSLTLTQTQTFMYFLLFFINSHYIFTCPLNIWKVLAYIYIFEAVSFNVFNIIFGNIGYIKNRYTYASWELTHWLTFNFNDLNISINFWKVPSYIEQRQLDNACIWIYIYINSIIINNNTISFKQITSSFYLKKYINNRHMILIIVM